MSGQVMSFHFGQFGINVAVPYWIRLAEEGNIGLDNRKLENNQETETTLRYFNENGLGEYSPLAVLVDNNPKSVEEINNILLPDFFDNTNCHKGKRPSNIYAILACQFKDYFPDLVDNIRKTIEKTQDTVKQYDIFSAFGGGTGSALSNYLQKIFKDEFGIGQEKIVNYALMPSYTIKGNNMEAYNALLGMNGLESGKTIILENQGIFDKFGITNFEDANELISDIPFLGACDSFEEIWCSAGFSSADNIEQAVLDATNINTNHLMKDICTHKETVFKGSSFCLYRTPNKKVELEYLDEKAKKAHQINNEENFYSLSDCIEKHQNQDCIELAYHSILNGNLDMWADQAESLWLKRAFIHWYVGEGLDGEEISYAIDFIRSESEAIKNNFK